MPNPNWRKGMQSPNPRGRPRGVPEFMEAARKLTPEALRLLASIMRDDEAQNSDRIKAAQIILDRGMGKPVPERPFYVPWTEEQVALAERMVPANGAE